MPSQAIVLSHIIFPGPRMLFLAGLVAKSSSSVKVMVEGHFLEIFMDFYHWGLGGSLGYTYSVSGSPPLHHGAFKGKDFVEFTFMKSRSLMKIHRHAGSP